MLILNIRFTLGKKVAFIHSFNRQRRLLLVIKLLKILSYELISSFLVFFFVIYDMTNRKLTQGNQLRISRVVGVVIRGLSSVLKDQYPGCCQSGLSSFWLWTLLKAFFSASPKISMYLIPPVVGKYTDPRM